jgi:glycosyltransferase involved in cell wall biosynthesis
LTSWSVFARAMAARRAFCTFGNVANYAYVTAKLLRRAGCECDVADPDFYHVVSAPEWYEARVSGDPGDQFLPKWSQLKVDGGYQRPRWFAQGPSIYTFKYLDAVHSGRAAEADRLWRLMAFYRRAVAKDLPWGVQHMLNGENLALKAGRKIGRALLGRLRQAPTASDAVADFPADMPAGVEPYWRQRHLYQATLRHYDIVQGYTTAGLYPAVCGSAAFTAYELGTLRGLPFEDSDIGRLTAWVYRTAPAVFVTNIDCIESAQRLGLAPSRVHPILHGYDTDGAAAFARDHARPVDRDPPLILAPARHHWKEGNLSWLKGNDVLIRAAGKLARQGRVFKLLFMNWGQEVDLSKQLIEAEGLSGHVEWSPPMARLNLWDVYMRAVCVADQFQAPAFGGVALDTLALGRRLVSRYDAKAGAAYFGSEPAMLNCASDEEVASALARCLDDPDDTAGIGARAQAWMLKEHGVERQLREQFVVYEALLDRQPAQAA